jgi:tRNA(fMet)-specific endonuclease VapC
MKFMLDTNACIFLIKKRSPEIISRIKKHSVGEIGISAITLAELRFGASKSLFVEKNHKALDDFILSLEVAFFDDKAASAYGDIRSYLEKAGTPIGSMDMLIGAHALSLGATVITNNLREFKRIKGLKVVDWTI